MGNPNLEPKKCFPKCEFFRCGQKAIQWSSRDVYCRYADDLCEGATCKYAICIRSRLLNNGLCGMTVKKITTIADAPPEEEAVSIKVRGKLHQRLREKELY
jgi:hypothetical protein